MLIHCNRVNWDDAAISRWLEPLASRKGEIAEVFGERLRELSLRWRDGEVREARARREEGASARRRHGEREDLVFVAGADEPALRQAVRALRSAAGRDPLPLRPSGRAGAAEEAALPGTERWVRRLAAIFARHAPRHDFAFVIRETERRVVSPGRPPSTSVRRRLWLEGRFIAASRAGDEERLFSFHAPASDAADEDLGRLLAAAAAPRDAASPVPRGDTDVVLANGCAAVLFHEILGHPLEAGAIHSPLSALPEARVAVPDLDVLDDARRLDLFGGYDRDDEGTAPRPVRLVHAGRVGSRLTDRAHGGASGSTGHGRRAGPPDPPLPRSSNIVVAAGAATPAELLRRLNNGIWIEEFGGGSVEVASGTFRLGFPRARRVRRGRFADELGPGILAGELLQALRGIEPALGRDVRICHSLGWCARDGQIVPAGGEAPEVLIRGLAARAEP